MCRLSPMWHNVDCSQLMSWLDRCQLRLVSPTEEHRPARNLQHETSQTTLTCSICHSTFSTHCTSFFVHLSCVFLEKLKHNMLKILCFIPSLILKWLHKNSPVLTSFFFNVHWCDSCHVQSTKIVLNEVKDDWLQLQPPMGENQTNFLANPVIFSVYISPEAFNFCIEIQSLNIYWVARVLAVFGAAGRAKANSVCVCREGCHTQVKQCDSAVISPFNFCLVVIWDLKKNSCNSSTKHFLLPNYFPSCGTCNESSNVSTPLTFVLSFLNCNHRTGCEMLLWFCLWFLHGLVRLRIFSWACWSFLCFLCMSFTLWRNARSGSLPIFSWVVCLFAEL